MTYLLNNRVSFADSSQLTAGGGLHVSSQKITNEFRYMYGTTGPVEMNDKIEGGGTLVPELTRNCWLAGVGTASGDRVVRQTRRYSSYIAGAASVGMITFVMNPAKTGLTQAAGMFDDNNGMFFRVRDTTPELVIRKGGVDYAIVPQNQWNGDRLDGSMNKWNPSGVLADWSKIHVLKIDFLWLGAGRVRFGFFFNEEFVIVHTFHHANALSEVYTYEPSLPCRWEIKNTATAPSASTLMIICCSAYTEASDVEIGFDRSISTGNAVVPVTSANSVNGYGILAIRLRNVVAGKALKAFARVGHFSVSSDQDLRFKLVVLPDSSFLSGTPTWTNVPGAGWCQYLTNFAMATGWEAATTYNVVHDGFSFGLSNNKMGMATEISVLNRASCIFQNYDSTDSQIMAIVGYSLGVNLNARADLLWTEIK